MAIARVARHCVQCARRAPFPRQRGDQGEAASGRRQERPGAVGGQEAVAAGFDVQMRVLLLSHSGPRTRFPACQLGAQGLELF
eukprot:596647-Alexandrium_andersonii.AAC.1